MSKQDRQGARTVTDLERKYNFGASFAEVYKLIDDVQVDSEKALEELDKSLTPEEIFNRLTGYKTYQGVFRGADGNLYVNAEIIKGGKIESGTLKVEAASITGLLEAMQINAKELNVDVANVTGLMEAGKIKSTFLEVSQANITGKLDASVIDVSGIISAGGLIIEDDLEDYATADDLSSYAKKNSLKNGTTTISGGCITTGKINLEKVELANDYGSLEMASGSTGIYGTKGAALYGPEEDIYFIVTDAACRMTANSTDFYIGDGVAYCDEDLCGFSDARLKQDITADVAERYSEFYKRLKPSRYHVVNGRSGRWHTGFIAQEIEQALADSGLSNTDLAALVHLEKDDPKNEKYGLRYTELIALNTAMIQKLMCRVDELENEIKRLKGE